MSNYATALSHIVLAGTGIYCYIAIKDTHTFSLCSFATVVANSLIGIWRWGNPTYGSKIDKIYRFTSFLQDVLALSFIAVDSWAIYSYPREYALIDLIISLSPLPMYLSDQRYERAVDTIVVCNFAVLVMLSIMYQNYYGLAACLSFAIAHFMVKKEGETFFDMNNQDLYNYALCFYVYFAMKAIMD